MWRKIAMVRAYRSFVDQQQSFVNLWKPRNSRPCILQLRHQRASNEAVRRSCLRRQLARLPKTRRCWQRLLTVITFNWLFIGTVVGFFCSPALVLSVEIPQP